VTTEKKTTNGSAERKRGRPAKEKPDEAWCRTELERLEREADQWEARGGVRTAREKRLLAQQLRSEMPKRFRAGKPAQVWLDRDGDEYTGPMQERRRKIFCTAVDNVKTLLRVRHIVEGPPARRLVERTPQADTSKQAAHLPALRERADFWLGRAWALGRAGRWHKGGLLEPALHALDTIEDWPQELRAGNKGRAIYVVHKATGTAIHTIKNYLGT
jgi:hypothetical protein